MLKSSCYTSFPLRQPRAALSLSGFSSRSSSLSSVLSVLGLLSLEKSLSLGLDLLGSLGSLVNARDAVVLGLGEGLAVDDGDFVAYP
jgi:hypothetical protein